MKYISILKPLSKEAIQLFRRKGIFTNHLVQNYRYPQEDFLIANTPVFVVSDGVTLNIEKISKRNIEYPNPSPAGDISRIFCENVFNYVKENYNLLDKENPIDIFKYANKEVYKYNKKKGKSNISGNTTGYYSATGSFVIIKDNKGYWASICDSFVAHFNKEMNLKFMSSGLCKPYAVINGEQRMVEYLERGVLDLKRNDRIFVFTDGFKYYMRNPVFLKLFKDWNKNLKKNIIGFSEKMKLINAEKYGHEYSVIAILF
jgi:hypothetical protein